MFSSVIGKTDDGYNVREMHVGLIQGWSKDGKPIAGAINGRSETETQKPTFRSAMQKRRVIVPVSGFYEWQKLDQSPKPTKQPWYIQRADSEILMLGESPTSNVFSSCQRSNSVSRVAESTAPGAVRQLAKHRYC